MSTKDTLKESKPLVLHNQVNVRPHLLEIFDPTKALPVKITEKGMMRAEKLAGMTRTGNNLVLEIGTVRCLRLHLSLIDNKCEY